MKEFKNLSQKGYKGVVYSSFNMVVQKWDSLYTKCNALPFQSSSVIKVLSTIPYRLRTHSKLYYCEIYNKDDKLSAIISFRKCNKEFSVGGGKENLDFVDCVYDPDEYQEETIIAFIDICRAQGGEVVSWRYIPMHSQTNLLFQRIIRRNPFQDIDIHIENHDNVAIEIVGCKYDDWNKKLKKSVRQNLRTSYNRLERDKMSVRYEILYASKTIQRNRIKALQGLLMNVYAKHLVERYDAGKFQVVFRKLWHYVTKTLLERQSVTAVLWINDEIAGFMNGYISNDHAQIYVPRLAINDKYLWYSPGYVLVNETVKSLIESRINVLNLDRGAEKYKLDMGGYLYKTTSFEMRIDKDEHNKRNTMEN